MRHRLRSSFHFSWATEVSLFPLLAALLDTIDHGGLVLQLDGSALIFSPRLAKLCCLTDDLLAGGERFARS